MSRFRIGLVVLLALMVGAGAFLLFSNTLVGEDYLKTFVLQQLEEGLHVPRPGGAAVDGGYRLTGKGNFGSGTGHSEYVAAGFMPLVDGELVYASEGIPRLLVAILPRQDVTFTDGWFVQGLRGTGSYDYERNTID